MSITTADHLHEPRPQTDREFGYPLLGFALHWFAARRTMNILRELDDHQLEDVGISPTLVRPGPRLVISGNVLSGLMALR